MVTDIFRGLGRRRDSDPTPIEQMDSDSLCARLGVTPGEAQPRPASPPVYLRIDGPQPAEPRSWRASTDGTPR